VYIAQLRAKLGDDAIRTVHGVGYVLDPETTP
jgi:DNA-binding response OmpR family regulator